MVANTLGTFWRMFFQLWPMFYLYDLDGGNKGITFKRQDTDYVYTSALPDAEAESMSIYLVEP